MPDERIAQLRARQEELVEDSTAVMALADAEKRDLSPEEGESVDANTAELKKVIKQIEQREEVLSQASALDQTLGRQVDPTPIVSVASEDDELDLPVVAAEARPSVGPRGVRRTTATVVGARRRGGDWGFQSFGEQAQAVYRASISGGRFDPRLDNAIRAASTNHGETSVGEQGGFLIAPDFRTAITEKVAAEDTLLGRTDQMQASGNTFVFPADETTPWQTAGGVLAFWEGEGKAITGSQPSLEQKSVRLNKLTAMVAVTEELLEDAPALDAYLRRKAPEKMNFKLNLAIIQGTGVGQPLGVLNSPALVTIAKESAQVADTIMFENVRKMWASLYSGSRAGSVWLMNQDVETALPAMEFPSTAGTFPVYLPPGGLSGSPFSTLLGRPIIPTEACNQIGDAGDVILADLGAYMTVRKAAGIRVDTSMHLYFDQDIMAFRFVYRVGGLPWWSGPVVRREGANALSCFVTLAERS